MLAITAADPGLPQKVFDSALLSDSYPLAVAEAGSALPSDSIQQSALAKQYALAGHVDEAIALYGKLVRGQSGWAAGHYNLAMLYL